MLRKLDYSVTFPTGRTLCETVRFQGGFGAITGPNESGKSMIVEMIRFCLFGSAALRGQGDDYKTLKAQLELTLKGDPYVIERCGRKATIAAGDQILAAGTTAVNLKVLSLLGFNLEVFDMSCVANQNRLLELGQMRPTERRRRVDSVIGVSVIDDLAKSAGDEALMHHRAADDLSANLREPIAPVAPEGYRPSVELAVQVVTLEKLRAEADQLRVWLQITKIKPQKPVDEHGICSSRLQVYVDQQMARKLQRQMLEAEIKTMPAAPDVSADELDAAEKQHAIAHASGARRAFLTRHRKPDWDQAKIDSDRAFLSAHANWRRIEQLESQRDNLLATGNHTCPACDHRWPIAAEGISSLDEQIAACERLPVERSNPYGLTDDKVESHQRILDDWLSVVEEWITVHSMAPEQVPDVRWTAEQIGQFRLGIANQAYRQRLLEQLREIKTDENEPDYTTMLREQQQYEARLGVWTEQIAEYTRWQDEKQEKTTRLGRLDVDLQQYPRLKHALEQSLSYEQQMNIFEHQRNDYKRLAGQVAAYRADAEDWRKVKNALQLLRSKIKQYLVPSLSRVASTLIHHMTGGARQVISVDEEFNIVVDGQEINTLSGSGEAVANLALRIGLGQVLTNNVLSLFMGDEIDASMDKKRSENLAAVLQTLKSRISQLLLVSHKLPAADYYITLGENSVLSDTVELT